MQQAGALSTGGLTFLHLTNGSLQVRLMDGTDDIIIIRDTEKQEAMETSGNSDDVTVGTKDQV